jgi:uncharacterized membrane protein YdjX (TVP38/TMEM64 family)
VARWIRIASAIVMVGSLLMLVRLLPVDRLVALLSQQVDRLGIWGPVLFAAAYVLAAVLFIPGSALTLAAGAIFGLATGTTVVSIAATMAAAASFLIGRYLARDAIRRKAARNPRFAAIDAAIGEGGWKIIALLRLSPAIPFSLGNYLFGLTAIRFWPYVVTSWIAMLPGTFLYVYLGYAGRAGLNAASGSAGSKPLGQWMLLAVGLLATVVVTVYVTRLAKQAIRKQAAMIDTANKSGDEQVTSNGPRVASTVAMVAGAVLLAGCTAAGYAYRTKITKLFGPPSVTLAEKYEEKPGPKIDHGVFDTLLRKHVDEQGRVDYVGLKQHAAQLDAYIATLGTAPVAELGRNERLALLINAYNAFTLRLILDHAPLKSIKDIPAEQRWDAKRWLLGGETVSLTQIEHEMIRPNFREPRIHFALVCAAKGCPPLRNEAFTAEKLDEQLESQTRYVHSHAAWFQFDPKQNVLKLTSLYKWYGDDFRQVSGSVPAFAAQYSDELKRALDAGQPVREEFMDYDWSLNAKDVP